MSASSGRGYRSAMRTKRPHTWFLKMLIWRRTLHRRRVSARRGISPLVCTVSASRKCYEAHHLSQRTERGGYPRDIGYCPLPQEEIQGGRNNRSSAEQDAHHVVPENICAHAHL